MLGKAARVFDLIKWVLRARRRPLPSSTKGQHQVQHGLLLDVVVRDRVAILELVVLVDEALLLGRDALLVPDEGFNVGDGGVGLHIECDGLAPKLHEDFGVARVVVVGVVTVVGIVGVVTAVGIVWVVTVVGFVVALALALALGLVGHVAGLV